MATWMVHFRIADKLMDNLSVNAKEFIVGNIGPDCGEPNADWSMFNPSSNVTHWKTTEYKSGINSESFYETYLKHCEDKVRFSFYLGYYVHLLTDILWSIRISLPIMEQYKEQFEADKNFIWKVKEDWYDLDHRYLREHIEFRAFRIFDKITEFPNIYLEYYSDTAIERQIKYISEFYNSHQDNLDREYRYLTEDQMNEFIEEAVEVIRKDFISKNICYSFAYRPNCNK